MTRSWAWAFGKVSQAVEVLVTDSRDARHRVRRAADYFLSVSATDLPASCRTDFEKIRRRLLKYPPDGYYKNALDATFVRTRNVTASRIAADILRVYTKFQHAFEAEGERAN